MHTTTTTDRDTIAQEGRLNGIKLSRVAESILQTLMDVRRAQPKRTWFSRRDIIELHYGPRGLQNECHEVDQADAAILELVSGGHVLTRRGPDGAAEYRRPPRQMPLVRLGPGGDFTRDIYSPVQLLNATG